MADSVYYTASMYDLLKLTQQQTSVKLIPTAVNPQLKERRSRGERSSSRQGEQTPTTTYSNGHG